MSLTFSVVTLLCAVHLLSNSVLTNDRRQSVIRTKKKGGRVFRRVCHYSGTGIFGLVRTVKGGGACPRKKKYPMPEWSVLKLGNKSAQISNYNNNKKDHSRSGENASGVFPYTSFVLCRFLRALKQNRAQSRLLIWHISKFEMCLLHMIYRLELHWLTFLFLNRL